MGETQRHQHAVTADPSPASGEVPEQHVQPHIDPSLVDDGHVDGQLARALYSPREQPSRELGVLGELTHEALVQNGQPRGLEHEPVIGEWKGRLSMSVGGTQDVALTQQLSSETLVDPDAVQQDSVEDEQPQTVFDAWWPACPPGSGRDLHLAGDDRVERLGTKLWVNRLGQFRIFLKYVADVCRRTRDRVHNSTVSEPEALGHPRAPRTDGGHTSRSTTAMRSRAVARRIAATTCARSTPRAVVYSTADRAARSAS